MRLLTPAPGLVDGLPLTPDDAGVHLVDLPEEGLEPIRMAVGRDASGRVDRLTSTG